MSDSSEDIASGCLSVIVDILPWDVMPWQAWLVAVVVIVGVWLLIGHPGIG